MKLDGVLLQFCVKNWHLVFFFSGKHCVVGVSLYCLVENFLCLSVVQWKTNLSMCMFLLFGGKQLLVCIKFLLQIAVSSYAHMLHTFWGNLSEVFSIVVWFFGNVMMCVMGNKVFCNLWWTFYFTIEKSPSMSGSVIQILSCIWKVFTSYCAWRAGWLPDWIFRDKHFLPDE